MIRRHLTWMLLLANLGLLAGLAYLWVDANGELRNIHWQAPLAQKPVLSATKIDPLTPNDADTARFMAIVDRPLFSPSRRPPPPPPPPDAKPAYDPLNDVQLYGVFTSGESGGIMAKVEGKIKRVHYGEKIGDWTLKSVKERDVNFQRDTETKTLNLAYVKGAAPPPRAAPPAGAQGVPAPAGVGTQAQRVQQEERERIRMLNEFRAKVGAPLLPMP